MIGTDRGSFAYVFPFVVFLLLLSLQPYSAALGSAEPMIRVLILAAVLVLFSRQVIELRPRYAGQSIGLGLLVFLIWISPELLFPHYRENILFHNILASSSGLSLSAELRHNAFALVWRTIRAVVLVPIIEELFWRAWLMRYLVHPNFREVPLGAYSLLSFGLTALLFASEHGAYWDVGLAAGILYNSWMIRTRSLADCILAHAVTNGALCAYVLVTEQWQFWQ